MLRLPCMESISIRQRPDTRWRNKRHYRKSSPVYCKACSGVLALRSAARLRWCCRDCKRSYTLQELGEDKPRIATREWLDVDARLRAMVRHAPMTIEELTLRLGVRRFTVIYHVNGRDRGPASRWSTPPATGLHIYDGQVYTGTMREWRHYP